MPMDTLGLAAPMSHGLRALLITRYTSMMLEKIKKYRQRRGRCAPGNKGLSTQRKVRTDYSRRKRCQFPVAPVEPVFPKPILSLMARLEKRDYFVPYLSSSAILGYLDKVKTIPKCREFTSLGISRHSNEDASHRWIEWHCSLLTGLANVDIWIRATPEFELYMGLVGRLDPHDVVLIKSQDAHCASRFVHICSVRPSGVLVLGKVFWHAANRYKRADRENNWGRKNVQSARCLLVSYLDSTANPCTVVFKDLDFLAYQANVVHNVFDYRHVS